MLNKVLHDIPAGEAFERVLIIQHEEEAEASVYCPPINGAKAYSAFFSRYDEAEDFAILKAQEIGQRVVHFTRDRVKWWLPT